MWWSAHRCLWACAWTHRGCVRWRGCGHPGSPAAEGYHVWRHSQPEVHGRMPQVRSLGALLYLLVIVLYCTYELLCTVIINWFVLYLLIVMCCIFFSVRTRIHKILYACKMEDESPPDQIALLRERCDKKEACDVDPKALFTKDKCPGKSFSQGLI